MSSMRLSAGHSVLDLCCGAGLFSIPISDAVSNVTAVDFAQPLVDRVNSHNKAIQGDVIEAKFPQAKYDRVVIYAGIQYFSYRDIVRLVERIYTLLAPGGSLFLGDVPDQSRIWNFFNSPEREGVYFDTVKNEKPIIGTWIDPSWLEKLSRHLGFSKFTFIEQPKDFPYTHYRFDALLEK